MTRFRDMSPLEEAITLATRNVREGTGGPFGAVIADSPLTGRLHGDRVAAPNRVTSTPDPTAHAEIEAIRTAARLLGSHDLSGLTLYASCQPCPMCAAAILWARLDGLVYAATAEDAAAAGFDDGFLYDELGASLAGVSSIRVLHQPHPMQAEPFAAWGAYSDRIDY